MATPHHHDTALSITGENDPSGGSHPSKEKLGAWALIALSTGTTLGNVGGNVMPELLAGFGEHFSLSDTAAGMVAAAQLISTAIVTLTLSKRASRPGRIALARWGLLVAAVGFIAAWLSPITAILVVSNVVAGAGLGAVFAAGTAALASTPSVDKATTRTVFVATVATAALIVLVSLANGVGGGTTGFALLAACCLLGLWTVRGLPERPSGLVNNVDRKLPLLFLFAVFAFGVIEQGTWSYSSIFGQRQAGLDDASTSLVLGVAALAALAGVPIGTLTARRFGRVIGVVSIGVLEFAAKSLVVMTDNGTVFAIAACLWQVCYLALLVQILAIAAHLDRGGRIVAATAGAIALGTGVGPALVGSTLDLIGSFGLAAVLLAIGLLALIPLAKVAGSITPSRVAQ